MYLNITSIRSNCKERELVFWGCSEDWVPKTRKLLPEVHKICDIQFDLIGNSWENLKVFQPNDFLDPEKYFIVITSGSFESIVEVLIQSGFVSGLDFSLSPVFEDFKILESFDNEKIRAVFTSSDYPLIDDKQRSSRLGGGLYEATIHGSEFKFHKVYEGSLRQIVKYADEFYAVDYSKNMVIIFDENYNVVDSFKLSRRHCTGIAVDNDHIFVLSSADDIIVKIGKKDYEVLAEYNFGINSGKGLGCYHINDCWLDGPKLFFTYFSKSGLWRNEIFDGGISVLDTSSGVIEEFMNGLFQPHSPIIHENDFYFCESTEGKLFKGTNTELFHVNSFIRGISFHTGKVIFGQSETLYLKRLRNRRHLLLNSGLYLFDERSKLARFFPTLGIKNIHQVVVL